MPFSHYKHDQADRGIDHEDRSEHAKQHRNTEFRRPTPATRLAQTTANNTLLQTISCNKLRIAHMLLRLCCKVLGTASLTRSHDFSRNDCCCSSHVWECEVHRHSTKCIYRIHNDGCCLYIWGPLPSNNATHHGVRDIKWHMNCSLKSLGD